MLTNSFDMKTLRRRAKKTLKKRYNKVIKLGDLDKIWEQYYTYAILKPLLKYGKVQIDDKFSIEIVGQKIENNDTLINLMINGLNVNGVIKKAVKFDDNRPGVVYKIVVKDSNYKGQLIFEANPKLKKAVADSLKNTQIYYRICR